MIECYYRWCPHHSVHVYPQEGPYCNIDQCLADCGKLQEYEVLRRQELEQLEKSHE